MTRQASSTRAAPHPPPTAMAQPQAYQQQHPQQNKGTLVAGQTIAVNRYTVQVERYLSQGTPALRDTIPVISCQTRWLRARIPCPNSSACLQHDTSCLETSCCSKRSDVDGGKERGRHNGAQPCSVTCFLLPHTLLMGTEDTQRSPKHRSPY